MKGYGKLHKTDMVVHDIFSDSQRKKERVLIVKSKRALFVY